MRRDAPSLAATATTLVALVAMAASGPLTRGLGCVRPIERQVAPGHAEGSAVRAVAAFMAAAARDLLAPQHLGVAHHAAPIELVLAPTARFAPPAESRAARDERPGLAPRLLDLPPPLG